MSVAVRTRLMAKWRTMAMFRAPWPLRSRDWSSAKVTSSTQCRRFSIAQCSRTAWRRPPAAKGAGGDEVAGLGAGGALGPRPGSRRGRGRRCRAGAARRGSGGRRRASRPRADAHAALLDAAMALVEVGVGVEALAGLGEGGLDLGAQGRLVGLDREQLVGALGGDGRGDRRRWWRRRRWRRAHPSARPRRRAARERRDGGVSLALSATASCASTSRSVVAKAETRCSGAVPALRSWLRREVLPSMATRSAFSGQLSRTQAVKAAANSPGSMRFIRMVSQRSPGTPCS